MLKKQLQVAGRAKKCLGVGHIQGDVIVTVAAFHAGARRGNLLACRRKVRQQKSQGGLPLSRACHANNIQLLLFGQFVGAHGFVLGIQGHFPPPAPGGEGISANGDFLFLYSKV